MALRLPIVVGDPRVQQCLDFLSRQFPLGAQALADGAKELFPQLATPAATKINFGTTTLKFSASKFAEAKEVTHELGTTPKVVIANSANDAVLVSVKELGATKFKIGGSNWFGAESIEPNVYWIAIG